MPTHFWCLFVGFLLPFFWGGFGAFLLKKEFGHIDANHPRVQSEKASGVGARARGAQYNAWEALAVFAPSLIVAYMFQPASTLAPKLAFAWVALRVLHGAMYLAKVAPARTAMFVLGLVCSFGLYLIGAGVIGS